MRLVRPWTGARSRQLSLSKNHIHVIFVEPPTTACLAVRGFSIPPAARY